MSTNYYMEKKCACCDSVKQVHLGKSSMGWTFTFRADKSLGVVDFNSWLMRVKVLLEAGYTLTNEYGDNTTLDKMLKLVNDKKKAGMNHAKQYADDNNWVDGDDNSFTNGEFS